MYISFVRDQSDLYVRCKTLDMRNSFLYAHIIYLSQSNGNLDPILGEIASKVGLMHDAA